MMSAKTFLASAGLVALLGGCMGTENRGLESVHQPVVDRTDYALDLRTAGDGLAAGEPGRLAGWFDALRLGYGDRVAVADSGGRAYGARAEVGGVVAGYGLLVSAEPAADLAPIAPGTVRVVVSRARASVPGCPDWSRDSANDLEQHTSSNYGCAGNVNLAAMIADPADLLRGRDGSVATDPVLSGKAIQAYRKAPGTGAGGLPGGISNVSAAQGGK